MIHKFLDHQFLESLPADNFDALLAVCAKFKAFDMTANGNENFHEDYAEFLIVTRSLVDYRQIAGVGFPPFQLLDRKANINAAKNFFNETEKYVLTEQAKLSTKNLLDSKKSLWDDFFKRVVAYEFSDRDFSRIQVLLTELREYIVKNTAITEGHRSRLLKRLEAMQRELHKKTSDIDRFWGFIGEVSINARKFGEDMAPITMRARELGAIVIAVIYAKEGMALPPEVVKLLLPDK